MDDRFNLARFRGAQDAAGAYETALDEIRAGRKISHRPALRPVRP